MTEYYVTSLNSIRHLKTGKIIAHLPGKWGFAHVEGRREIILVFNAFTPLWFERKKDADLAYRALVSKGFDTVEKVCEMKEMEFKKIIYEALQW